MYAGHRAPRSYEASWAMITVIQIVAASPQHAARREYCQCNRARDAPFRVVFLRITQ